MELLENDVRIEHNGPRIHRPLGCPTTGLPAPLLNGYVLGLSIHYMRTRVIEL